MAVTWRFRNVLTGGFAAALVAIGWGALAVGPEDTAIWLDAPLDGATVPMSAEVEVVGHVAGSGAIAAVRLDVDGTEIARAALESPPGELATVRFSWRPTSAGPHALTLWASGESGEWTGPAIASVDVAGDMATTTTTTTTTTTAPSATTAPATTAPATTAPATTAPATTAPATTAPTATTTPTTTTDAPPTTIACEFEPPGDLDPPNGHVTPFLFATLSWDYAGCRPALEFEVEVSTSFLFLESVATARVAESSWTTPDLACGTYWWRVRPANFDVAGPWSNPMSFTVQNRSCP